MGGRREGRIIGRRPRQSKADFALTFQDGGGWLQPAHVHPEYPRPEKKKDAPLRRRPFPNRGTVGR
ncbi:protein of unknown function [Azospirillum lipoferum 4B]|uniref:Uncharacterized protein n=1 Tax=Azospirillum lipoferum (strain 4B) TaxID=862719 RepID=G7Z3B3_AZOL4|nr:protein of unknown function [Azospirillum lipoferum 4B]